MKESEKIKEIYSKRESKNSWYSPVSDAVVMSEQEKYRTFVKWINTCKISREETRLLEIGCGRGINFLFFLQLGFKPENLAGNELIEERFREARKLLPSDIHLYPGDAADLKFENERFDVVFQSMVFTSILDDQYRSLLAKKMWNWIKRGGGILWYDFIYNNPANKDVKGIPVSEVLNYFPASEVFKWKITLAPPVSRIICKIHPVFYTILSMLRFTRTHYLIYLRKSE